MTGDIGSEPNLLPFLQLLAAIDLASATLEREEFTHTARVAARCCDRRYRHASQGEFETIAVAWLHDVVEAGWDGDLHEHGFSERVVAAADAISRRKGEVYAAYIRRVKLNPLARTVKLADLEDHLSQTDTLKDSLKQRYGRAMEALA